MEDRNSKLPLLHRAQTEYSSLNGTQSLPIWSSHCPQQQYQGVQFPDSDPDPDLVFCLQRQLGGLKTCVKQGWKIKNAELKIWKAITTVIRLRNQVSFIDARLEVGDSFFPVTSNGSLIIRPDLQKSSDSIPWAL